ncbi:MAG: glycosyltransferase family 4 protein [Desulfobacterales bacterium]
MFRPNVCHLLYRYYPIWGGAENQAMILVSHLTRLNSNNFVVTRRFSKQHRAQEVIDGHSVYRVFSVGADSIGHLFFALSALWFLWKRRKRFDILHVHGSVGMGLIGLFIARLLGKKMVMKFSEAKKIGFLSQKRFGFFLLRLLKRIDRIVCISEKIHRNVLDIAVSSKKVACIPNGVDTRNFSPGKDKVKSRQVLDLDSDAFIALFTGRLVWGKGLDILLKSWVQVVSKVPESLLLVLGSDAYQRDGVSGEAKRFVEENNLSNQVRFLGAQKDVDAYLKCSDLFIFPARDEAEGLSNSLLEAMACGLPVIASDIHANRSIIENQRNGLLYPTEDFEKLTSTILMLKRDESIGRALGSNAHKTIREKYTIEAVSVEYAKLYQEILSE